MRKIKILHIVNSFGVGGMENGLVNIINYGDSLGFQHVICSLTRELSMQERIIPESVFLYTLNKDGAERLIFLKLLDIISKTKPDIVHVRHWGPLFDTVVALFLTIKRPKLVLSLHGMSYEQYLHIGRANRFIRKYLLGFVDCLITLNKIMAKKYSEFYFLKQKFTIIGNGVDILIFKPVNKNSAYIREERKKNGINDSDFVMGTVGRLDSIKNIGFLVRSILDLKKKIKNIKLLIVGEGKQQLELKAICKKNDVTEQVIFMGKKNNMQHIYPLMDIYVQSSLYEGFSNTILEAMSAGLPIICSKVGGNSCLVHHGKNGFLYELESHDEFVEYLLTVFKDKERNKKFSNFSRRLVEENWTIIRMVKKYEAVYQKLMI